MDKELKALIHISTALIITITIYINFINNKRLRRNGFKEKNI